MTYRNYDTKQPHRPLIDFIPDNLDVSDEEDSFYQKDDEYILDPQWKALVTRVKNRIPRRVQRYLSIYLVLLVVALIGWNVHFGPRYKHRKMEEAAMDATPKDAFGSNVQPEFPGMIRLKTLDKKHLPAEDKRLVVVGDVHGCRAELEELLAKIGFNQKKDHLILTGDMIAKGPDSAGVVSLAQKLDASCVRGNHEDRVLLTRAELEAYHVALPRPEEDASKKDDSPDEETSSHGDYKTRKLAKQFSKSQIAWLKQCPVILRVGTVPEIGEVVVVHAGLVPDVPLEQQDPFQAMNMRSINLTTRMPSEGREHTPWYKFWNHQQKKKHESSERTTVIYGHDRKTGLNIQKWSMGLDSGCHAGGHLTAMVIDGKGKSSIWQVKSHTNTG